MYNFGWVTSSAVLERYCDSAKLGIFWELDGASTPDSITDVRVRSKRRSRRKSNAAVCRSYLTLRCPCHKCPGAPAFALFAKGGINQCRHQLSRIPPFAKNAKDGAPGHLWHGQSLEFSRSYGRSLDQPWASVITVISGGQRKRNGRFTAPMPRLTYSCIPSPNLKSPCTYLVPMSGSMSGGRKGISICPP
jgi:hypothetical protein